MINYNKQDFVLNKNEEVHNMKKLLSLILAALLVASLCAVFAFGASAASSDLYVKTGGTGDGSSADKAFGSIEDAYSAAAEKTDDIVIHVVGEVTWDISLATFEAPVHTNKITFTGDKLNITCSKSYFLSLGGRTVFEKIEMVPSTKLLMRTNFNDIVFGEGVVVSGGNKVCIRCTSKDIIDGYDFITNTFKANANITVLSGIFEDLCIFQNGCPANLDGDVTITVGGTAEVDNVVVARNSYNTVNNATFYLNGGKVNRFLGNTDRSMAQLEGQTMPGVTGKFTVVVSDAFNLADSFNNNNTTTFFGISGPSIIVGADALLDKADYELQVAEGVWDAFNSTPDKVQLSSFDRVTKTAATTTDPVVTDAPATDAPATDTPAQETTAAPATEPVPATTAGGDVTPPTGDATLVILFAAAAVLCCATVLVIRKKKA